MTSDLMGTANPSPPRRLIGEALLWLGTSTVAVVALVLATGWSGISRDAIQLAQRHGTVWVYMMVTLWLAVASAWVLRRSPPASGWWKRRWPVVLAVLAGGFWLQVHEPVGWRVMFDEPGHAATAHSLHLQGSLENVGSAHLTAEGETVWLFQPAQRLGLYPFWGSLIHGLAGSPDYAHLFLLNCLLGFAFLAFGASLGVRLAGTAGAIWFVALLTFLPLTAQLAMSGSYDLLFGVLLLAALDQLMAHGGDPRPARLSLLFSLGAALTLCRYEGALFLGAIFVLCWLAEGRKFRPGWNLLLSSLALVPAAMVIRIFLVGSRESYGVQSTFGMGNIPGNVMASLRHLFVPEGGYTNLAPLGWLGLAGWLFLLWRRLRTERPAGDLRIRLCLLWSLALAAQNLFVVAASFWSSPADPTTTRLILPLWLIAAVGASAWLGTLEPRFQRIMAFGLGAWILLYQMPSWSRHSSTRSFSQPVAYRHYGDFARRMPPRSLFLSPSAGAITLQGFPGGLAKDFNQNHARSAGVVAAGHYSHVFALLQGKWQTGPGGIPQFGYTFKNNITSDRWEIRVVECHPLAGGLEAHFVEVVGWKDDAGVVHPMTEMPPGSVPPSGLTEGQVMAWRLNF